MRLVVDGNKYQKAKKAKHSWIQTFFLWFYVFGFIIVSFGENA